MNFRLQIQRNVELVRHLIIKILDAFNENRYTTVIFLELRLAFGTVDHYVLLKKFNMYGIRGKNLK